MYNNITISITEITAHKCACMQNVYIMKVDPVLGILGDDVLSRAATFPHWNATAILWRRYWRVH